VGRTVAAFGQSAGHAAAGFGLAAYHSITWFAVTPKAMPLVVRGEPVPAKAIVGMHYGAWALVSLIVLIAAGI
jgi:fumarate reductase subunit C